MGLQGRLEDEVWEQLARLSSPPRPAPRVQQAVPKPAPRVQQAVPKSRNQRQPRKVIKRAARGTEVRDPRATPARTAEQMEFGRRLSELRGLLRAMQAGNPVNGVTPGVTSARLRQACALAGWLHASEKAPTRKEQVELGRMGLQFNLLVKRYPALLTRPSPKLEARVAPAAREWQPCDVSKIPIGPESSRWFMDPVNSK